MSDNGTAGGEVIYNAGMKGSKWSYYDGGHRAPCFIRWPAGKLRSPGDIPELTQIQDILPTLSDLCVLVDRKDAKFDGVSLAPLLEGKPQDLSGRNLVVQVTTGSQAKKWECAVMADKWRLINGKELYNIEKDPGQKQDIADKNPEMVERLTKAYEKWWAELEPLSREPAVIPVGNEHENPVHLTSRVNGAWRLEVEQAGEYEIVLSRWPREIDVPITSGMPSYQSVDIKFAENNNWLPEGKALPITQARMQVGPLERSQAISPTDTTISFTVSLKKGPTKLQTWFDDRTGKPICGAYYVEVRRKNGEVDSLND
jgi:arylsulfatase